MEEEEEEVTHNINAADRPLVDLVRCDLTICGTICMVQKTAPMVPSAFSAALFSFIQCWWRAMWKGDWVV